MAGSGTGPKRISGIVTRLAAVRKAGIREEGTGALLAPVPPEGYRKEYEMSLDSLRTLPIPVPPMLEQALAYPGQARLVAFCWSSLGDEAMYADGRCSGEADWAAYLAFVEHPRVEPHLRPYDLGSSEEEARAFLMLDREARAL